jgi:hypothetical protein
VYLLFVPRGALFLHRLRRFPFLLFLPVQTFAHVLSAIDSLGKHRCSVDIGVLFARLYKSQPTCTTMLVVQSYVLRDANGDGFATLAFATKEEIRQSFCGSEAE